MIARILERNNRFTKAFYPVAANRSIVTMELAMCRNNILLKVKSPLHSRSLETCLQGADRRITVAKDLLDAMLASASEDSRFRVLITDADRFDPVERHLVNHLRRKHPDLRPVYLADFPEMAQWLALCTPSPGNSIITI